MNVLIAVLTKDPSNLLEENLRSTETEAKHLKFSLKSIDTVVRHLIFSLICLVHGC